MMKKWLKWLVSAGILMALAGISQGPVYANSMQSLDFHVKLQTDGSGIVTENRKMDLNEDTEIYIVMDNLGGSDISDFKVSDFGQRLAFEPNWDIHASRAEKAGKYGIVTTDKGYELCWGIGEYGKHEYAVTYTISGMVRQLKDGQAMNWQFFSGEGNINPSTMTLTVEGPAPMTADNTKIWGFGFNGEIHFENGLVKGASAESLSDRNYVTLLMQFMESPFQPVMSLNKTLAEQESLAKEGSSYSQEEKPTSLTDRLFAPFISFLVFMSFLISGTGMFLRQKAVRLAKPLMKAKDRRKLNKDQYFREIPYTEGPMTDVARLLNDIDRGKIENYFHAYLLKWLKEGHLDHLTEEKGFIIKKNESTLQLNRGPVEGEDFESRLWNMMQSAAGEDNRLEEKEFTKWAKKHYKKIDDLSTDMVNDSEFVMIRKGYLTQKEITVFKIFTSVILSSTDQGDELSNHLVQFENYLKDFSLVAERSAVEVRLWDELLIWASLYGIAKEVAEQFEKLYPEYVQESQFHYGDIYAMTIFTNSFASGYHSGQSAASRGAGGGTSIGGGGGSFGGGGGGSR